MTPILWAFAALISGSVFAALLWRWTSSEYGRPPGARLLVKTLIMFVLYFATIACLMAVGMVAVSP